MTALGAFGGAALGAIILSECSSTGGDPGGSANDAGSDILLRRDTGGGYQGDDDGAGDDVADTSLPPDAGQCAVTAAEVATWPGWRQLSEFDPCCPAALPLNPSASMPAWAWQPCTNGMAGCQEFVASWAQPAQNTYSGFAKGSRDGAGNLKWLMFGRNPGAKATEQDLFDVTTGAPLGAWREDVTATSSTCWVNAVLGQNTVTIDAERPDGLYLASGSPQSMVTAPKFQTYSPLFHDLQEEYASDSVFAFDQEAEGIVARTDVGSGTLRTAHGAVGLLLSMVEGHDVIGYSEHGTAGWGQLYGSSSEAGAVDHARDGGAWAA